MDFTSPEDALRFEPFVHARRDLSDRLRVLCSMYRSLRVDFYRHRAHWVPDRPHRHRPCLISHTLREITGVFCVSIGHALCRDKSAPAHTNQSRFELVPPDGGSGGLCGASLGARVANR